MGQGASKKKEDEFLATEAAQALAAKQFYRRATFAEIVENDTYVKRRTEREMNELEAEVTIPEKNSWQAPKKELAEQFQSENHPRLNVPGTDTYVKFPLKTSIMRLGTEFGPGIALYFRFLVFLGIVFFIYAACASPWVGINQVAVYRFNDANKTQIPISQVKAFVGNRTRLEGLSLAGVLEFPGYPPQDQASFLVDAQVAGKTVLVSREKYTALIQLMDIVGTLCFIIGVAVFFRIVLPKISDRIDEDTLEVADYTIQVTGIPQNTEIEEIVEFFESRYGEVVEVQLCQDDYELITAFKKRMSMVRKLKRAQARYAKGVDKEYKAKPVQKAIRKMDKTIRKLQKRAKNRVCAAFVTFEQERSLKQCLQSFKVTQGFFGWLFYKAHLKLRGVHKLRVQEAEPPTNINYENLKFTPKDRRIRKGIVFTLLLSILILTFLAVTEIRFRVEELQRKTLLKESALSAQLDNNVALGFVRSITGASSGDVDAFRKRRDGVCQGIMDTCEASISEGTPYGLTLNYGRLIEYSDATLADSGNEGKVTERVLTQMKNCYGATDPSECTVPETYRCFACYCEGLYRAININALKLDDLGLDEFSAGMLESVQVQCREYYQDSYLLKGARWGLVVFTTAINVFLTVSITFLVRVEKNHSKAEDEASLFTWIVLSQYINTAVLDMLANANVRVANDAIASTGFGGRILNGKYADFTQNWYAEVGNNILYTVLINAVGMPFAARLWNRVFTFWKRHMKSRKALIQEDLDEAYIGPNYRLSIKIAEMMMNACVALTYGTGLPLLYVIVAFSCVFVRFWLDKHELLRLVRTPPRYMESIIMPAYSFLMFFAGVHLGVGGWMIGHYYCRSLASYANDIGVAQKTEIPTQYVNGDAVGDVVVGEFDINRLFQANAAGNYIFLALLILGFIVIRVFFEGVVLEFLLHSWITKYICCCLKRFRNKKLKLEGIPKFSEAYEHHLLKGLTSYAITEHPEYRKAFSIVNALKRIKKKTEDGKKAAAAAKKEAGGDHDFLVSREHSATTHSDSDDSDSDLEDTVLMDTIQEDEVFVEKENSVVAVAVEAEGVVAQEDAADETPVVDAKSDREASRTEADAEDAPEDASEPEKAVPAPAAEAEDKHSSASEGDFADAPEKVEGHESEAEEEKAESAQVTTESVSDHEDVSAAAEDVQVDVEGKEGDAGAQATSQDEEKKE